MKIRIRVEGATPEHATIRVFANGASCGLLTARHDEIAELMARISQAPSEAALAASSVVLQEVKP